MSLRRKRAITLIELLIVMLLISTALSFTAMPIAKAIRKERFANGVALIISKLNLAQELSLDLYTDVSLQLTENEEGVLCALIVGSPLCPPLEKQIERLIKIPTLLSASFENQLSCECKLTFDAPNASFPHGELVLRGASDLEASIYLKGYPAHIQQGKYEKTTLPKASYPQEIFSAL